MLSTNDLKARCDAAASVTEDELSEYDEVWGAWPSRNGRCL